MTSIYIYICEICAASSVLEYSFVFIFFFHAFFSSYFTYYKITFQFDTDGRSVFSRIVIQGSVAAPNKTKDGKNKLDRKVKETQKCV